MSVKIRLSRVGRKNRPYWRVVAVDSRKKRDGEFLENLGSYDPIKHEILQLHLDKIENWVSKGAICSDTVLKLMKMKRKVSEPKKAVKAKEVKVKKTISDKKVEKETKS